MFCGYIFENLIMWNGIVVFGVDLDCFKWNNMLIVLCMDCNFCCGGVLQNVKLNWCKVVIVNIIVLVFFIFVYFCGCCVYRNSKRDGYLKGYL